MEVYNAIKSGGTKVKIEIKQRAHSPGHRLILYPDGLPSTGYPVTRQELYAFYMELRDLFDVDTSSHIEEPEITETD